MTAPYILDLGTFVQQKSSGRFTILGRSVQRLSRCTKIRKIAVKEDVDGMGSDIFRWTKVVNHELCVRLS